MKNNKKNPKKNQKKKGVGQVGRDSIPAPTYKNLRMMKSLQHDAWGGDASRVPKTTAKDSSLYRAGYEFGLKHWRSAPKQAPKYENKIYQGGRWEGQNVGKKINYGQPSLMRKFAKWLFD